jgi:hypothetical protein
MSEAFNFKSDISKTVGTFAPIETGRYTVKVIEAKAVNSKEKGTPQIAVTFQLLDEKFKNRKLFHNFTWSVKAIPFVFSFLKAIKSPIVEQDNVTREQAVNAMLGGVCSVYVDVENTINGTPRNTVSNFKEADGAVAPSINTVAQNTPNTQEQPLFK